MFSALACSRPACLGVLIASLRLLFCKSHVMRSLRLLGLRASYLVQAVASRVDIS